MSDYKYKPALFKDVQFVEEDLKNFYTAFEICKDEDTNQNRVKLKTAWYDLYLTLKQREADGQLNNFIASEVREYIGRLAYG